MPADVHEADKHRKLELANQICMHLLTNWTCHTSTVDTRHSFYIQGILELCFMKCVDVVKSGLEGSDSLCRKLREILHSQISSMKCLHLTAKNARLAQPVGGACNLCERRPLFIHQLLNEFAHEVH